MPKRDGPGVGIKASCFDCVHCTSESYRVQGDSGHDVYCIHPSVGETRKHIADTRWDTPDWCPLLPAAIRDLATRELRRLNTPTQETP